MSATQIDLDDDALEAAMRELGTTTKKDTVNAALREVAARRRRLRAFYELVEMGEQGAFDAGYEAWLSRKGLATASGRSA